MAKAEYDLDPAIDLELLVMEKKWLGYSEERWEELMAAPHRHYFDSPTYKRTFERLRLLFGCYANWTACLRRSKSSSAGGALLERGSNPSMLIFQGPHRGSVVGDLIAGPIPVTLHMTLHKLWRRL